GNRWKFESHVHVSEGVYIVKEFLGEGGFGKVAKCSKLWSLEYYAVKIMKISREGQKEFETMKLIQDLDPDENHLIKMYECFTYRKMTCIVYELLEVNFHDSLMNEQQLVPLCYIRVIAQQLLKALKALKSIGVAHCDIKLDNIMFKDLDDMNVKLIDFGLAVETNEILTGTKMQVTQFRAPEVILGLPLDESVDMWALGMALASMVHIFDAFFTRDNGDWRLCTPEEYTEITGNRVRYMNPVIDFDAMTDKHRNMYEMHDDDDHKAFIDLLKRMLEVNPQRRITPSQALEHDFITMKHLAGKSKAASSSSSSSSSSLSLPPLTFLATVSHSLCSHLDHSHATCPLSVHAHQDHHATPGFKNPAHELCLTPALEVLDLQSRAISTITHYTINNRKKH
uniref:Protein kinase domain-containing protein n=1 Tax=Oryzias latipes TaxID=8090 RepID=A0A3P9HQY9_ORYLA